MNDSIPSRPLPDYSLFSLVLSICSYFLPCAGLVMSIVSLHYANKSIRLYDENSDLYRSKDMAYASRIMSIIGIFYQILVSLLLFILLLFVLRNIDFLNYFLEERVG